MQLSIPALSRLLPKFLQVERRKDPAARAKPVTLSRQRIYILPTRYGLLFSMLLLIMLIGSTNYNNSLGYALTFLLASTALISILHTYRNMARLTIRSGKSVPVFCGEDANYVVRLDNYTKYSRYAIAFQVADQPMVITDIKANGQQKIQLSLPTTQRGWQALSTLTISTRFPLGIMRAWSQLNLTSSCLVYPQPIGPYAEPPTTANQPGGNKASQQIGSDDFWGFRDYRPGDSPRHIDWKAAARGQELLTKQFADNESTELWLDWDSLPTLNTEARLSQLCRWVLDLEDTDLRYGLRLPKVKIPIGLGGQHKHNCLEALALFEDGQ